MSYMSYCRFEGTAGDFGACVEQLQTSGIPKHNEYEAHAAQRLYNMCQEYMDAYEEAQSDDFEPQDEDDW